MKTTSTGRQAEQAVCVRLQSLGYRVIAQNWRSRWCEIDIIATKKSAAYLVEVKYRANNSQGFGFDYITTKKLIQMRFAAEIWAQDNDWSGQILLVAAAVSGTNYEQIEIIELSE